MDRFPTFKEDEEGKRLNIEPGNLRKIVGKLISEFNLELKEIEDAPDHVDYVAVGVNPMGKETKCLIRARDYTVGLDMEDVEDLYEDMTNMKATSAIFLTGSHFTKDAKKFAKDVPIRLVDGVELGSLMAEHAIPKAEFAFLSAFSNEKVVGYFKKKKGSKFLGLIGTNETIEEIDRRYIPVGHFEMKTVTRESEITKNVYMDLSSGSILYMEENRVEEDKFLKKILDLPEDSQTHLLDLIKYGELRHKNLDGKPLNILEKENLVRIEDRSKSTGIIDILLDEITSTVSVAASEISTMSHAEPKDLELKAETKKYVKEILQKPEIDSSYDLGHFIESDSEIKKDFDPDPVHYEPDKVAYILDTIYKKEDVSFKEMAYLPYYRCKYVSDYGAVHFRKLFSPKFKKFVPKKSPLNGIYRIIDTIPAIPFLLFGLLYILLEYFVLQTSDLQRIIHVFAIAFIFVAVAVLVGVMIKVMFKTERRMPRYGGTIIKYGFPSIHAIAAAGAIAFGYFVNPLLEIVLVPLGILYIHSRLRLGVHSQTDIFGGVLIGGLLGLMFGLYVLDKIFLGEIVELILAVFFFAIPLVVTFLEPQYR